MNKKPAEKIKYHVAPGITSFTFQGEPHAVPKSGIFECTPEEAKELLAQNILVMSVADTSRKAGVDLEGNPPKPTQPQPKAGKDVEPGGETTKASKPSKSE
jgi:hypothetical protein